MKYESGRMGVAEGMSLAFILLGSEIFLCIWSVIVDRTATAAWLVPLISGIIAGVMFLLLLFVFKYVPGDLFQIAEYLLGKTGAKVIILYFITVFFSRTVLLLRQFGDYSLLTAMPDLDMPPITGWYTLMAAIIAYFGIEPLARAMFIILPIGLAALSFVVVLVYNKFHLYNLTPWLGAGLPVLLQNGGSMSGFFIGIFTLPIMAESFQNLRTIRTAGLLAIGLSTVMRIVVLFIYVGIFSMAVGREKSLPFFEMTRLAYLSSFFQRLEALYIPMWVIFGIAAMAAHLYMTAYLLTRLFGLPSFRPLILPLAIITAQLSCQPPDIATTNNLYMQANEFIGTPGLFAIPAVLFIAVLLRGKRRAEHAQ